MAVDLLDPDGLPKVGSYRQVSVATGSRLVFLAGQVAVDEAGATVGAGDLAAQVERCYLNVATALSAAGATFDDITKVTVYIVDWTPEKMTQLAEGMARASATLGTEVAGAPLTGIGVSALAAPEMLVEIEATAILD